MEGHSRPILEYAHRSLCDTYRRFRKNACKDCPCCYDRLSAYDLYYPKHLDCPMHGQRALSEWHLGEHCRIDWQLFAFAQIDLCQFAFAQIDLCQIDLCLIGLCLSVAAPANARAIGRD